MDMRRLTPRGSYFLDGNWSSHGKFSLDISAGAPGFTKRPKPKRQGRSKKASNLKDVQAQGVADVKNSKHLVFKQKHDEALLGGHLVGPHSRQDDDVHNFFCIAVFERRSYHPAWISSPKRRLLAQAYLPCLEPLQS